MPRPPVPPETSPRAQPWWRRALPFVIAIALVAFVLARLDRRAFLTALARVDAPAYLAFALAFVIALLSADTFATVLVYRRSIAPISFRRFFVLRGASYLPSLLNHHVGQVFIAVSLSRGVPLARVAGATLVVTRRGRVPACSPRRRSAARAAVWSAVAIAPRDLSRGARREIRGLARITLLSPLRRRARAPRSPRGCRTSRCSSPHLIPFRFFGVRSAAAALYVPILMVAVTLPLTPQGFGTRDVLAAALFERFAAGATKEERLAAIAAATTSWAVAVSLIDVVLGLALLRAVLASGMGRVAGAARGGGEGVDRAA
jgi:hypothetical protein